MMCGGEGGLEAEMRGFSLVGFTLLSWNEGWTYDNLGSLSLTTDRLMTFDTGTGSINLGET